MGMYDDVKFEFVCPICGTNVEDFQSKDGACMLDYLNFWEVNNFYAGCSGCGAWVEFYLYDRENKKREIKDYSLSIKKRFDKPDDAKPFFKNPKEFYKIEQERKLKIFNKHFKRKEKTK